MSSLTHHAHDEKESQSFDELPVVAQYEPPKKHSRWGMIWDTFDAPPEERKLLFKLDAVLLTFCAFGYFLKYLDQANVSSAFVSGMKEDLNMYGNQLTYSTTMWTIGYVIGQIPSNLILTRVAPRYWISALEIGWGICTLASYKVKTYQQLYAIRFFVGLFESGFYPAAQYLLGSFYKPGELGKRAVLFHCMGAVGQMISSVVAAATYTNLDGVNGIQGWRWLFIIDAVITLPIAVAGLVFLPSLPGQKSYKSTFWLSEADLSLISKRMASVGRAPMGPLTVKKVAGYLGNWHIYLIPLLYILWNNSGGPMNIMSLWLKSFNTVDTGTGITYTTDQINYYNMPVWAMWAICGILAGWMSDGPLRGRRWPMIVFFTSVNVIVCVALLAEPVYHNIPGHFVLYYMTGCTAGLSGLLFAWANEICAADNEERALIVVLMNDLAYVVQAIIPNFAWKTVDYPKSTAGLSYSAALSALVIPLTCLIRFLHGRDGRKAAVKAARSDEVGEESKAGRRTPTSLEEKEAGEDGYPKAPEEERVSAHTELVVHLQ